MSHLSPALYSTLAEIMPDLHVHCVDPWCLIGSTAALLLGAQVGVADVDVLASRADADALMEIWAERREPDPAMAHEQRFRSHFARFCFPHMMVEVMGALELNVAGNWQAVTPGRMVLAGVDGLAVPVPSVEDQIRLLESFGRVKDAPRVAALRAITEPVSLLPVLPSH
ncbi:MAG: hypothetical protein ABI300_10380 [Rhodanobacter sp.]